MTAPAPKRHLLPGKFAKTFPHTHGNSLPHPHLSEKKDNEARRCFETEPISFFSPQFFFQGKLFSKMTHFCQTFHS